MGTSFTMELEAWVCPLCGALYGIPKRKLESLQREGGESFCSSGHRIGWHRKTREQVEQELEAMRAERDAVRREKWRLRNLYLRALKRAQKAEAKK
jgi:hypothetical protein